MKYILIYYYRTYNVNLNIKIKLYVDFEPKKGFMEKRRTPK